MGEIFGGSGPLSKLVVLTVLLNEQDLLTGLFVMCPLKLRFSAGFHDSSVLCEFRDDVEGG